MSSKSSRVSTAIPQATGPMSTRRGQLHSPRRARTLAARSLGVLSLVLGTAGASAAEGLQAPDAAALWPVWQARMTVTLTEPAWAGGVRQLRQAAVLGDYYLRSHGEPQSGWRGGFRATSGVVVGHLGAAVLPGRSSVAWMATAVDDVAGRDIDAWPYIGLGYSGLATRGGWGITADFGLALRQPAAAPELGRALLGLRGWEGALRQVDLMPMLQLGMRYTF